MYYVYLLRCVDGTLYTGFTNDLARRLTAHNAGKGGKIHPEPPPGGSGLLGKFLQQIFCPPAGMRHKAALPGGKTLPDSIVCFPRSDLNARRAGPYCGPPAFANIYAECPGFFPFCPWILAGKGS